MSPAAEARHLVSGLAGIAAVTLIFTAWAQISSPATVALSFLIVVLFVAATARLRVAVATSVAAMVAFNFFFLPPVGTLTIADPENWFALLAFLAVSLVASHLSSVARARTLEAVTRRDELARLFDLSRDLLLITDSREAHARLAGFVSRRFDLDYAAICVPHPPEWTVFRSGPQDLALDPRDLSAAFATVDEQNGSAADGPAAARHQDDKLWRGRAEAASGEGGASAGHRVLTMGSHTVHLVPLRLGTKP